MATTIRAAISENNKYYVEKHRYYELKHFCLQYPIWAKAYKSLDAMGRNHQDLASFIKTNVHGDKTMKIAAAKLEYRNKMELVETTTYEADDFLAPYLFKAVTEGLSYPYLKTNYDIPCSKDMYYDRYRKFFWLLSKKRD